MAEKKLNNLLGIDNFKSVEKLNKKPKVTKRTNVAKDVLQENAYVTGKKELSEKPKTKETYVSKKLNNLINLEDFTKSVPNTSAKPTKRTSVAKDIIQEKKSKDNEECEEEEKEEKDKKKSEEEPKKGLSAAQKKLPKSLQNAILKKQKK
mgnify:CR=1 FL=1